MRSLLVLFLALWPVLATAQAPDNGVPGPVVATVLRVVDGDTLDVQATVWPDHLVQASVRILGVDTPELRGKCESEKNRAQDAKRALAEFLQAQGNVVFLHNVQHDKYAGRVLATVSLPDGQDITEWLIQQDLARPYDGGRRQPWCP